MIHSVTIGSTVDRVRIKIASRHSNPQTNLREFPRIRYPWYTKHHAKNFMVKLGSIECCMSEQPKHLLGRPGY